MPKCFVGALLSPGVQTALCLVIPREFVSIGTFACNCLASNYAGVGRDLIWNSVMIKHPARRKQRGAQDHMQMVIRRSGKEQSLNSYLTPAIAAFKASMSAPKSFPSLPAFLYGLEGCRR